MNVEALWVAYFGDATLPTIIPGYSNAGTVVLETGRLFGGDFAYYYVGSYRLEGDNRFMARATITHFNGPLTDAFNLGLPSFEIAIEGTVSEREIKAQMFLAADPTRSLPLRLERKAELP
jgi:hypothetical protein